MMGPEAVENRTILDNQVLGVMLAQRDTLERIERLMIVLGFVGVIILGAMVVGHVSRQQ